MILKDFIEILDEIAAFSLAEPWDNVGLMVGDNTQEVHGILVALDPTAELLDEAEAVGANTIVTHHPLIFHPLKSIRTDEPIGSFLARAMSKNIAVLGCHTNLDKVDGGVNDILATKLGLTDTAPLIMKEEHQGAPAGFGRIGRYSEPVPKKTFIKRVLAALNISSVKIAGALPDPITRVAVCGGSGSDLAETAYDMGAQVYITGETKLSLARWAEASGFCIVDAGHFPTENVIVPALAATLRNTFADKGIPITVRTSSQQTDPFIQYAKE